MKADAELLLQHGRHAGTVPEITSKAVGFRTMPEEVRNQVFLLWSQAGRTSGSRMRPKRLRAIGLRALEPTPHHTVGHTQGLSNRDVQPAALIQFPSAKPAPFPPATRTRIPPAHATL